jgi:putative inorganic carbon (hco3(-)) transporter
MQYPMRPKTHVAPTPSDQSSLGLDASAPVNSLYRLKLKELWAQFKKEGPAFAMICGYLIIEYVRPQAIFPVLEIIPWGLLTLLFALLFRLFEKNTTFVKDGTNYLVILFNLVILASCFNAQNPSVSWANIQICYYWLIIYFLVTNIVTNEARLLLFIGVFLLASAKLSFSLARIWAMRGFTFTTWGLQGPGGFLVNSGELSIQMLVYGPLALFLAIFFRPFISKWMHRFLLLMPITAVMVVVGASSRGAQVAMAYQFYPTLLKGRLSLRNLLLAGLLGYAAYAAIPDAQMARFTSAGDDQTSQQRLLYWKRGLEIIQEYPVLGIGLRNFPTYFEQHYPQDMLYAHAQLPHNIFIEVGTDAGYLGLGMFLALIIKTMLLARRVHRIAKHPAMAGYMYIPVARGLIAALWGYLIAGQFVTVTYYPFFWVNLAMMVCLANVTAQTARSKGIAVD